MRTSSPVRIAWCFDAGVVRVQASLRDAVARAAVRPASELAGYCQWSLRDRRNLAPAALFSPLTHFEGVAPVAKIEHCLL
jgi:hypothetical protein